MLFSVSAWDANCPRRIRRRIDADDVSAVLAERDRRIAELQAEVKRLEGKQWRRHDCNNVASRSSLAPQSDTGSGRKVSG